MSAKSILYISTGFLMFGCSDKDDLTFAWKSTNGSGSSSGDTAETEITEDNTNTAFFVADSGATVVSGDADCFMPIYTAGSGSSKSSSSSSGGGSSSSSSSYD